MKLICSWCGKDIGEKEPLDNPAITHGICGKCYFKELEKLEGKEE